MCIRDRIDARGLRSALEPLPDGGNEQDHKTKIAKLRKLLLERIDDECVMEVSDCKTLTEILERLKQNYQRTGNSTVASLLQKLQLTRFDNKDLEQHLSEFDAINAQLS